MLFAGQLIMRCIPDPIMHYWWSIDIVPSMRFNGYCLCLSVCQICVCFCLFSDAIEILFEELS